MLKKYKAIVQVQQRQVFQDKRVHVATFTDNIAPEWEQSEAREDPSGWSLVPLAESYWDRWEAERDALDDTPEDEQHLLCWQRNLFGMKIRDVYSFSSPAQWLTAATQTELQALGARLVADPAEADLVVGGDIKYLNVDMYMATWCNLVVDVNVTPRGQPPMRTRIHTSSVQTAWFGTSKEVFKALMGCEQKFEHHLLSQVVSALRASGAERVSSLH